MNRALTAAIILAATATQAAEERRWPDHLPEKEGDSYVRLHEPTSPDAVATVTFKNEYTHRQDEIFQLEWNGITVNVTMDFAFDNLGSERLTVEPLDGYIAVPPSITIIDGDIGEIQIIEWIGG